MRPLRLFTPEEDDTLRALRAEGVSFQEIGRRLDRGGATIINRATRLGIYEPRSIKPGVFVKDPILLELFRIIQEQGLTGLAVSQRAGLDKTAVSNWRRGHIRNPSIFNVQAALNAIGFKLAIVPLEEEP